MRLPLRPQIINADMPPETLYTIAGSSFHRHKLLGGGGEGEVYSLKDNPRLVAKLYFENKLPGKEEKIREMIPLCTEALRQFAAIPIAPLYNSQNSFVGFLMDLVEGAEFHKFLSKSRQTIFPNARWNFFVRVAKNLARSVEALHQTGFIVGDINESNVFILQDATVKIIDCDSFQFHSPSQKKFLCEVRKPEYTPPELQDLQAETWRTENNDYFSLAVLIFQILFINRHPFTGITQTADDPPIGKVIKDHRFAFGSDSKVRGWLPPPYSLNLEETSPFIETYFRRSFLTNDSRPTAKDWIKILGNLENSLKKCSDNNGHFYPDSNAYCPWCRIEEQSNYLAVYFDPLSFDTLFDLDLIWKEICSVPAPKKLLAFPEKTSHEIHGWAKIKAELNKYSKYKIALCILIFFVHLALLIPISTAETGCAVALYFVLGFITYSVITGILGPSSIFPKQFLDEKKKFEQQNKQIIENYRRLNSGQSFSVKLRELEDKKDQYLNLGIIRAYKLQELEKQALERQEFEYLSRFRISEASIPQIGYSRALTLRSFGIETAADLSEDRILAIRGFGESRAFDLMYWRDQLLKKFKFNSKLAVTESDKRAIEREIFRMRGGLERNLKQGKSSLLKTVKNAQSQEEQIQSQARENIQKVIEAEYKLAPLLSNIMSKIATGYLLIATIVASSIMIATRPINDKAAGNNNGNQNTNSLVQINNRQAPPDVNSLRTNITSDTMVNSNVNINASREETESVKAYKQGISYTRLGQFKEAAEFYELAISSNPNFANAYHELGYAYLRLGEYDESIEASNKAIELRPKNIDTYKNLANAYQAKNDSTSVCRTFEKAKNLAPNNMQIVSGFNKCLIDQGDFEKAVDSYKTSINNNPRNAALRYELGKLFIKLGRSEDAIDQYNELVRLNSPLAQKLVAELELDQ